MGSNMISESCHTPTTLARLLSNRLGTCPSALSSCESFSSCEQGPVIGTHSARQSPDKGHAPQSFSSQRPSCHQRRALAMGSIDCALIALMETPHSSAHASCLPSPPLGSCLHGEEECLAHHHVSSAGAWWELNTCLVNDNSYMKMSLQEAAAQAKAGYTPLGPASCQATLLIYWLHPGWQVS